MSSRNGLDSFEDYTRQGTRKYGDGWQRIVVPVLIIYAVVAVLVAADYWMNYGKIYRGVSVGSVPLGSKTPEEARKILKDRTGGLKEIKLTGPQEEFTLTTDEMGVNYDVQATVDQAYAVGRRGSILERLGDRVEAAWGTVRIPPVADYERERLRNALSGVFAALTVEPAEAGFKVKDGEVYVTESRARKSVEEEKLLDDIEGGLFEGKREYEVSVVTEEPKLTTEEAERLKPTTLLGRYRTNYTLSSDTSEERVENLRIASNAVSGTFLAPGEVFSANEILSPLEYNETKVIIEGREAQANGGGLCQVSSTLYMVATYAGLEIVERHPHHAQLPYIRPGLDATVWFGSLDMKFKNDTDGYLLIREYVAEDGYIYAEIWGRPTGKEVEMDSEPEYVGPDYSEWVTYQKVKENGKVVFDDVLRKDTYKPLVDEKGKVIPPTEIEPAPVNP